MPRPKERAAYYMINCAHLTHFERVLEGNGRWRERVRGLRANASTKSHAELDEATELDDGDPADLGNRYAGLRDGLPQLNVLGGCCGTDHRHVIEICDAWLARAYSLDPPGLASVSAPEAEPGAAGERSEGAPSQVSRWRLAKAFR